MTWMRRAPSAMSNSAMPATISPVGGSAPARQRHVCSSQRSSWYVTSASAFEVPRPPANPFLDELRRPALVTPGCTPVHARKAGASPVEARGLGHPAPDGGAAGLQPSPE